jgi:hypothetical protein
MTDTNPTPHLCPACGLPGCFTDASWDEQGRGAIGIGICPCCFYEPGFDDDPAASADAQPTALASIRHYRAKWVTMGMPWRGNDDYWLTKPEGWDPAAQLQTLFETEPDLK